ncbi:MAG: flagellar protein FliT [Gammaproteobacteria bacterium]|nr:flagellar protein FliT [Gammaproteobacteria bacterium]
MTSNVRYLLPKHYADVVLRLSKKIAELAHRHEWQSARKLEAERHIAMQELFSHPDINEALPSMTEILQEVMQLDAEVIVKGETELQQMAVQINGIGKGKRAVNAYLKT